MHDRTIDKETCQKLAQGKANGTTNERTNITLIVDWIHCAIDSNRYVSQNAGCIAG